MNFITQEIDYKKLYLPQNVSLYDSTQIMDSNPIKTAIVVCNKLIREQVYAIIVSKPENGELSPASVSYTAGFYHIPVIGISSRDSAFSDKVSVVHCRSSLFVKQCTVKLEAGLCLEHGQWHSPAPVLCGIATFHQIWNISFFEKKTWGSIQLAKIILRIRTLNTLYKFSIINTFFTCTKANISSKFFFLNYFMYWFSEYPCFIPSNSSALFPPSRCLGGASQTFPLQV